MLGEAPVEVHRAGVPPPDFHRVDPAGAARHRVTRRRQQAAAEVAGRGITPAEAERHAGVSWPVAHQGHADRADQATAAPGPVAHLGIDEHRRGRPRFARDEEASECTLIADRWHTCFCDLSGDQGLLCQVEGRTADDAAWWLAEQPPAWRDAVQVVAIDMCSIYASAVQRMFPRAGAGQLEQATRAGAPTSIAVAIAAPSFPQDRPWPVTVRQAPAFDGRPRGAAAGNGPMRLNRAAM